MVMGMGASKMNNTNIAIGLGVVVVFFYWNKNRQPVTRIVGVDAPMNYGSCGTMWAPNYGNDNAGTYTEIEPTIIPQQPQERSVWTKDEGSWLWGWGPNK